jgi:hypothetical protein
MQAVCANPAALGGGSGELHAYLSARGLSIVGSSSAPAWAAGKTIETPWVSVPGLLTSECVVNDKGSYLEITVHGDPNDPRTDDIVGDVITNGEVNASWGLHLIDVNLAMGSTRRGDPEDSGRCANSYGTVAIATARPSSRSAPATAGTCGDGFAAGASDSTESIGGRHTNSCALRRVSSSMSSKTASMRCRISRAATRYSGSADVTCQPSAVASALKLAGPSAQPRIARSRSSSVSANILRYSSKERPQETIWASVNTARAAYFNSNTVAFVSAGTCSAS